MQSLWWIQRFSRGNSREPVSLARLFDARGCERGTTAIEYALIASLLAILAIAGIHSFGSSMNGMYIELGSAVKGAG